MFLTFNAGRERLIELYETYSHLFDTSKSRDKGVIARNAKVPGLLSEEGDGRFVSEYIALRCKCYSILYDDETTTSKSKGVSKNVVRSFNFQLYYQALAANEKFRYKIPKISVKNHVVYSSIVNKIALSRGNDKRNFKQDETTSHPWGYFEEPEDQLPFILSK
jgi:hypothetical protein